jgi:hypothetical protein
MEKEYDARLASLMKKYTPNQAEGSANVWSSKVREGRGQS